MNTSVAVKITKDTRYARFKFCTFKTDHGSLIIKRFGIFTIRIFAPGFWEFAFMSLPLDDDI